MSYTYQKFLKKQIDLTELGIQRIEGAYPYFCTPKGAKIIGWAGVDGIHYGFIRGFGDMVFAISPMNTPGNYVHPLAKDFSDFLRLLLACGSADVLEQAYGMEQGQFDCYLQENVLTESKRAVMDAVEEAFGLTPMEGPFAYIKALQKGFDYSRIHFTEDYEDFMDVSFPQEQQDSLEWGVYFEGGFGWNGKARKGEEAAVAKKFDWEGEHWFIPAVYLCSKGLVADFCLQVAAGRIQDFIDKWNLSVDSTCECFDYDTQMQIDADNPLSVEFYAKASVNGREMEQSACCSVSWNPCVAQEAYPGDIKRVMGHYGLDPDDGWAIYRISFPWAVKRRPKFTSFSITLERGMTEIAGPQFQVSLPGDTFHFIHPVSGVEHVLTVQEYRREEAEDGQFGFGQYEYPKHNTVMVYTVSPDLADTGFFVRDCKISDSPREKNPGPGQFLPQQSGSCEFCLVGGAYSPTAIAFGDEQGLKIHAACSALHFVPEDVVWRMIFREKMKDGITLSISL